MAVNKTHRMDYAWNDLPLQWLGEVHMKNDKWEVCSVLEERQKGVVCQSWLVIGEAFRPPHFQVQRVDMAANHVLNVWICPFLSLYSISAEILV